VPHRHQRSNDKCLISNLHQPKKKKEFKHQLHSPSGICRGTSALPARLSPFSQLTPLSNTSLTRIMVRLAKRASKSPGPTSSSATPWSPSTTASLFFRPCKNPCQTTTTNGKSEEEKINDKTPPKSRTDIRKGSWVPHPGAAAQRDLRRVVLCAHRLHEQHARILRTLWPNNLPSELAGFKEGRREPPLKDPRFGYGQDLTTDAASARNATTARSRMGALGFGSIPGMDLANPRNALRFGRMGDPFLAPFFFRFKQL
jgi:hypothetical protein